MTTNSMGPIPDPWTILVFISALADNWPSHLSVCDLPLRYDIIQLLACGRRSSLLSLANRVGWSTRSKALEKSIMRQRTYEHLSKVAVTWWSKKVRAYSATSGMKGKLLHYTMGRNSWQDPSRTIFSATRERRGVTEIGLYSESVLGLATLGTGVSTVCRHCKCRRKRTNSEYYVQPHGQSHKSSCDKTTWVCYRGLVN